MKFFNILDEQNRFIGLQASLKETGPQEDSHGASYAWQRAVHMERGSLYLTVLGENGMITSYRVTKSGTEPFVEEAVIR